MSYYTDLLARAARIEIADRFGVDILDADQVQTFVYKAIDRRVAREALEAKRAEEAAAHLAQSHDLGDLTARALEAE